GDSLRIPSAASFAPTPLSIYQTYLSHCSEKVAPNCRDELHSSIIYGNQIVSETCCSNLVNGVGTQCFQEMAKFIVTIPNLNQKKEEIFQRSIKVWKDCAAQKL
ncbi:hypothetical protein PIB30_042111, partial [Stylosanthes scabra]|nr:hypothetical protein [Stylosanthes scabra]